MIIFSIIPWHNARIIFASLIRPEGLGKEDIYAIQPEEDKPLKDLYAELIQPSATPAATPATGAATATTTAPAPAAAPAAATATAAATAAAAATATATTTTPAPATAPATAPAPDAAAPAACRCPRSYAPGNKPYTRIF